ncbi:hypothetical protein CU044_0929 [Streptomyces sp. L-9-10]|nr:hypothetical protein CU044_0929 [Streptomyces sp. L-9-10]
MDAEHGDPARSAGLAGEPETGWSHERACDTGHVLAHVYGPLPRRSEHGREEGRYSLRRRTTAESPPAFPFCQIITGERSTVRPPPQGPPSRSPGPCSPHRARPYRRPVSLRSFPWRPRPPVPPARWAR